MKIPSTRRIIPEFAAVAAILCFVLFLVIALTEMYVRWYLNQEFTFLGGFALETFGLMSLGLTLGLLYLKD